MSITEHTVLHYVFLPHRYIPNMVNPPVRNSAKHVTTYNLLALLGRKADVPKRSPVTVSTPIEVKHRASSRRVKDCWFQLGHYVALSAS